LAFKLCRFCKTGCYRKTSCFCKTGKACCFLPFLYVLHLLLLEEPSRRRASTELLSTELINSFALAFILLTYVRHE
jgi:hypothetical protein